MFPVLAHKPPPTPAHPKTLKNGPTYLPKTPNGVLGIPLPGKELRTCVVHRERELEKMGRFC